MLHCCVALNFVTIKQKKKVDAKTCYSESYDLRVLHSAVSCTCKIFIMLFDKWSTVLSARYRFQKVFIKIRMSEQAYTLRILCSCIHICYILIHMHTYLFFYT